MSIVYDCMTVRIPDILIYCILYDHFEEDEEDDEV